MRVNELIARNTSLATEKSSIQKRLEETQEARLALERKINSLQSGGQPAKEATSLPTKPDPSVSILSDLQSRYRLKSSQTQIGGLERHLREWKTKANELESTPGSPERSAQDRFGGKGHGCGHGGAERIERQARSVEERTRRAESEI